MKAGQSRRANSAGSSFNEQANDYNVTGIAYDKNGNIMTLNRHGVVNSSNGIGDMDKLIYGYGVGNKLMDVTDSGSASYGFVGSNLGDDYDYDANGNMVSDANKGITGIVYNHLNLPKDISINGSGGNGTISYIYDATGTKLRKKVVETGKPDRYTYYAGNNVYEGSSLKYFSHPEGYVDTENGFDYVYQYKDHLGNIRLSYKNVSLTGTPSLQIQEENNYYPFGLQHKGYNNVVNGTENNYQTYQGQELDKELGLNWHQFKFRTYDASIGRFLQIDLLAPTYVYNSTYAFAENNVTSGINLEGLELSFEMDGNRATGGKQDACMICNNRTYTLQEVRSEMSKQQTQRAAQQKMIDALPAAKSNRTTIDYPTSHIERAKYLYPQSGLMMAEGVGIGAKEAVTDVALGGLLYGAYRGAKALGSVWDLNKFVRGRVIEDMLGANKAGWASNFPVIDKIEGGVATSIKSLDLTGSSYQKGNSVFNALKGYINKLDNFTSQSWAGVDVVQGENYTSKALELAVQTGKGTDSQWNQIGQAIQYALDKDINVTIRFID